MGQKGFATLEVILMVVVIGILASIAVPRFTSVTAAANTAKIQADLSTIDTAIAIYYMEHGKYPDAATNLNALDGYLQNKDIKPPKGYAYVNGDETPVEFTADTYGIKAGSATEEGRGYLKEATNTADKFYVPKKSS